MNSHPDLTNSIRYSMKKLLILIVFAAVFLHFYPQEELTLWYEKHKNELLNTFAESTDTKVRLKAEKIYQDLTPKLKQFKQQEKEYLQTITSDRQTLSAFYDEFCQQKKQSAKLHANNQTLVCNTIRKYSSLF